MEGLPTELLHRFSSQYPAIYLVCRQFYNTIPQNCRQILLAIARDSVKILERVALEYRDESINLRDLTPEPTAGFCAAAALRADSVNCFDHIRASYPVDDETAIDIATNRGAPAITLYYIEEARMITTPHRLHTHKYTTADFLRLILRLKQLYRYHFKLSRYVKLALCSGNYDFVSAAAGYQDRPVNVNANDVLKFYRTHYGVGSKEIPTDQWPEYDKKMVSVLYYMHEYGVDNDRVRALAAERRHYAIVTAIDDLNTSYF